MNTSKNFKDSCFQNITHNRTIGFEDLNIVSQSFSFKRNFYNPFKDFDLHKKDQLKIINFSFDKIINRVIKNEATNNANDKIEASKTNVKVGLDFEAKIYFQNSSFNV